MKSAIITDVHLGVRNDSIAFHNSFNKFFTNVFFPELKKRGITHVINAGDMFDNRKKIDIRTAELSRNYFFEPLREAGIEMDIIAGNHDVYFRELNETTALTEVIGMYENIKSFTETEDVIRGGTRLCYIPWINKTNRGQTFERIACSQAEIAFGHLELIGHSLYRGQPSHKGDDPGAFTKYFKHVYTGHFHHKNTIDNITYLGSVHQHTWSDAGDVRGFHIFDTNTYEMEFIANPYNMFETVDYEENPQFLDEQFSGKFVRVYYDDVKQSSLDKFIKLIDDQRPEDLKSVQRKSSTNGPAALNEQTVELEDTPSLIRSLVDEEPVYNKLISFYNTAHELL